METPIATADLLKATIEKTLDSRTTHRGEIVLPCVPVALEYFLENLGIFFRDLGKPLSHSELSELRVLLAKTLDDGFRASGNNQLVLSYETITTPFLTKNLKCSVAIRENTVAGKYENWQQARENGSLFGSHPDTRVISLVEKLVDPREAPILDIGAGNGRNAVPLAQRGHPVDALEDDSTICRATAGSGKGRQSSPSRDRGRLLRIVQ